MNTLDTQPDTELAAMLAGMTFSADELACLRDDSGEYDEPAGKVTIDKEIGLAQDLKLVRRATKRKMMELLQVSNAAKHLERMPEPGESFHCVVKGNYRMWDCVRAALELEHPAKILDLTICTLSFNQAITDSLENLLQTGRVKRARILCSHYYASLEPEAFDSMAQMLSRFDQKLLAFRLHSKIILIRMSGNRHYSFEGSSNLRSNRNVENFVVSNDRKLWKFHRDWMEALFGEANSVKIDHDSARAED